MYQRNNLKIIKITMEMQSNSKETKKQVMNLAHEIRIKEGYTFSQCLKWAWKKIKLVKALSEGLVGIFFTKKTTGELVYRSGYNLEPTSTSNWYLVLFQNPNLNNTNKWRSCDIRFVETWEMVQ